MSMMEVMSYIVFSVLLVLIPFITPVMYDMAVFIVESLEEYKKREEEKKKE